MIELDIKFSLETLTGLNVYALQLPYDRTEGITYQCISDPYVQTGLAKSNLVAARYQITFYIVNNYPELKKIDKIVWKMLRNIRHSYLGNTLIQHIERVGILEDKHILTDNSAQYIIKRDYIFYYSEEDD